MILRFTPFVLQTSNKHQQSFPRIACAKITSLRDMSLVAILLSEQTVCERDSFEGDFYLRIFLYRVDIIAIYWGFLSMKSLTASKSPCSRKQVNDVLSVLIRNCRYQIPIYGNLPASAVTGNEIASHRAHYASSASETAFV